MQGEKYWASFLNVILTLLEKCWFTSVCNGHRFNWFVPKRIFLLKKNFDELYLAIEHITQLTLYLRYVGVVWFILHVLQPLLARLTQRHLCCSSKYAMEHLQKPY